MLAGVLLAEILVRLSLGESLSEVQPVQKNMTGTEKELIILGLFFVVAVSRASPAKRDLCPARQNEAQRNLASFILVGSDLC